MKICIHARVSATGLLVLGILFCALGLRLVGFRFGLPSLYDPDEPFFVITGLKLLHDHTLNPGWFGHPGTTTIYALALIELAVLNFGILSGRFANIHALSQTLYLDPSMIFVPARLFIIACGVLCVGLTFLVGRRLFGDKVGLTSAALLAINPLHIQFSQIIRTDVQSTVFLLLCTLCCIGIIRRGRLSDYLLAALCLGFACATKWPAATVGIAIPGACLLRCRTHPDERMRQARQLAAAGIASVAALFVASPYLFLDFHTVLLNLSGEAQIAHLGATGGSFGANLLWYATHPLRDSFGIIELLLAAIGFVVAIVRDRCALVTIVAASVLFMIGISSQRLIWSRWVVPLLPFLSVFVALGLWTIVERVRAWGGAVAARLLAILLLAGTLVPIALTDVAQARERLHDTRAIASAWAKAHIPVGSTVLVEYPAFDLLREKWQFLYPAGRLGCVDGRKALAGGMRTSTVADWRDGRAIIDIGTIAPAALGACRASYAIFTDYDRYLDAGSMFRPGAEIYETLARGGTPLLTVRPVRGEIGGPVVRIVRLAPDRRPIGQNH